MNHADFWVIPRLRAISHELIPFLAFTISHIPVSHLPRLIGLASKMVPVLTLNCLRQPLQFQNRLASMKRILSEPQSGHLIPFGQRRAIIVSNARDSSEKY